MRDFRPVVEFQFGQAARKQSPPGTFTQDQGAVGQIDSADGSLSAPEKLDLSHDLSRFQCGEPALDEWLRRRALRNEESDASPTYVICVERQVVGYYTCSRCSCPRGRSRSFPTKHAHGTPPCGQRFYRARRKVRYRLPTDRYAGRRLFACSSTKIVALPSSKLGLAHRQMSRETQIRRI